MAHPPNGPEADLYPVRGAGHNVPSISPTDVSTFLRLNQCRRYLRLRLHQRVAGPGFLNRAGVKGQAIQPLFTKAGREFEERVTGEIGKRFRLIDLRDERPSGRDAIDNDRVARLARDLTPSDTLALYQSQIEVVVGGWLIRGAPDLIRLERDEAGSLTVLVVDIKSSKASKVEHRLQVAFYDRMLARLLAGEGVVAIQAFGILYRGLPFPDERAGEEERAKLEADAERARALFNVAGAYLELVDDQDAYRDEVARLVTDGDSVATAVAEAPFASLPFTIDAKCDDCLFGEFCLAWAADHDDLSLIPGVAAVEKAELREAGVATVRDLAALKAPRWDQRLGRDDPRELEPAKGWEKVVARLHGSRAAVGRLDELIHRARQYRRGQGEAIATLRDLPSKGYPSLPASSPELHPNLVRVSLDAQFDFLANRVYALGALVSAARDGAEDPSRQRTIVELAEGPPETEAVERTLLVRWTRAVLTAIAELAEPDANGERRAPIHLVIWSRNEQKVLLDALSRHAREVFGATALFDFVTQLAGYDSPVVTYLDEEIRTFKNYPLTSPSLQRIARFLGFDWAPFDRIFRERLFDAAGRREPTPQWPEGGWYTRRPRHRSQIPLEYAYAAWKDLGEPRRGEADPFGRFRHATLDDLARFEERRLAAIVHVARDLRPNPDTIKTSFDIPTLDAFSDRARNLADALREFIMVERHVELAEWRSARNAAPEQRARAGLSLLARYDPAEQEPGVAERNTINRERSVAKDAAITAMRQANPDARWRDRPKAERDALDWSCEGMVVRLRLVTDGVGIGPGELLDVSTLRRDDQVLLLPRWTVDGRKPSAEQVRMAQTPKQLLKRGMRAWIEEIADERDAAGQVVGATVALRLNGRPTNASMEPFVYAGHPEPLLDGEVYTIEPDPNSFTAYWASKVISGLQAGQRNTLFARFAGEETALGDRSVSAEARERFLAGLDEVARLEGREPPRPAPRSYLAAFGTEPLLLVQGPPGTGKSYTTAFAILAHVQAALAAGHSCRIVVSANTHAATDVLLEKLIQAQADLRRWQQAWPDLFARRFDPRLLDLPLYRFDPRPTTPSEATPLRKKNDRGAEPPPVDVVRADHACVVAATPGGVYSMLNEKRSIFGHAFVDGLVLDEASRMTLPDALMAALPLAPDAPLVVVGDHRQMQPIRKHNWEEPHRTFRDYAVYRSLFDTLRSLGAPMIRFDRSYRLHRTMAETLRRQIYWRDGIDYHSLNEATLRDGEAADPFVRSALAPEYPIVVVVHDEAGSRQRNAFEAELIAPLLTALRARGYDVAGGLGVVVPHRAQRALLREAVRQGAGDAADGAGEAVDTVERFQGGERDAIIVSATESDPAYLLQAGEFLYDPTRLNVALSRAKEKLILVASRSVFDLFSPDEELFANALLWKNLLRRTCTVPLWDGTIDGRRVEVWGNTDGDRGEPLARP